MLKWFHSSNKLRAIHLFNHIMLIPAIIYGDWTLWLMAFLWWNFLGSFGISIGFHRLLSHKSFQTYSWFENFCIFVGCLATGGSPLGWAGVHRMHHSSPDLVGDPHSPKVIGAFRSYFHLWGQVVIKRRYVKDLIKKPFVIWCHRNYFKILLFWMTALYLINPLVGIFLFSIPAVFAFHAYGQINTLGHKFGYRTYATKDTSRNNWFVNILTCGEGWHNNHHQFPNSYRIGLSRWEFDLSAWILEKSHLMISTKKQVHPKYYSYPSVKSALDVHS